MISQHLFNIRILTAGARLLEVLTVLTLLTASAHAQNPVPFIDQPLVPDATAPGGPGFTLTVNGAGFVSGSVVNWNGSPRTTTFVSKEQLTAAVPASDLTRASSASITVVNPSPGGGTSTPAFFEVRTPTTAVKFTSSQYYFNAAGAAVGDFNRDGILDLAVSSLDGNYVTVLLGKGDGTFYSGVDYATGLYPGSVAVGDFKGDGKLDLAVTTGGSGGVSVLLGNGDGTFQPFVVYATGNGPLSVATGDFNGDGKLDLVTANNNSNESGSVSVLLGNGDGTFQPPVNYAAGNGPYSVAVGDFTGHDNLDLAVVNYADATLSVFLGNGDGTFQPQVVYALGGQPISVATGDLNRDGKLDLAVADYYSNRVDVLLGNGDGTFKPQVDYATGSIPFALVIGDFNGDNKLDLAVAADGSHSVSLLLGNGDGTFQTYVDYAAGDTPQSLAAGDFTGNGRLDLCVDNYYGNIWVLLQTGGTKSATSTTLVSSLNPSVYGQSVTWTATVKTAGSGNPTGTVTFSWDGYSIGAATLNSSGVATLTKSNLNAYTYPLTAAYSGDANNAASTSAILSQVVDQATSKATLTSSPNPSTEGQTVTFTATITSPTVTPTGLVTFTAGTTQLGSVELSGGKATLTTSTLAVGSTTITVTYPWNSNIAESSSSVVQIVEK